MKYYSEKEKVKHRPTFNSIGEFQSTALSKINTESTIPLTSHLRKMSSGYWCTRVIEIGI